MRRVDIVIPVYNVATTIGGLVGSLSAQRLESDVELRIIVVDDGSSDQCVLRALKEVASTATLVRHPRNRGRAAARNSGAKAGRGDYLVFLDADCLIADETFVMRHLHAIGGGLDVSAGLRAMRGTSFLAAFETGVNARRMSGPAWAALTSANFAIRRRVFEACGGFDERYCWYGFEDRDLAARLHKLGYRIGVSADAVVYHGDALTMAGLLGRLEEAGEYTSGLFLRDHPEFYAQLHYGHFDFRLHPYRARILYLIGTVLRPIFHALAARAVSGDSSAFALKALAFRAAVAHAFLNGTRRVWVSERR